MTGASKRLVRGFMVIAFSAPLVAAGYLARDVNMLASVPLYIEVALSGGSTELKRVAPSENDPSIGGRHVPLQARYLFTKAGKEPRADKYLSIGGTQVVHKAPRFVVAAITPFDQQDARQFPDVKVGRTTVNRADKSDRLQPTSTYLARSIDTGTGDPWAIRAASATMFMLSPSLENHGPLWAAFGQPEGRRAWPSRVHLASLSAEDGSKLFGGLTEEEFRARELRCMATAIYFEARSEPREGQIAVAQVIMNRVRSNYYPDTICGVVFQGQWNHNACQFSFACDGRADRPRDEKQWAIAQELAREVTAGKVWLDDIGYATHYHATYVRPKWVGSFRRIKQIGRHIFYKAPFIQVQVAEASKT